MFSLPSPSLVIELSLPGSGSHQHPLPHSVQGYLTDGDQQRFGAILVLLKEKKKISKYKNIGNINTHNFHQGKAHNSKDHLTDFHTLKKE